MNKNLESLQFPMYSFLPLVSAFLSRTVIISSLAVGEAYIGKGAK